MIYTPYWYEKRLRSTLNMVGGPGISFATSIKAGQADAVHRFLQAYAAHFREAKSVSAEMLAHD